MKDNYLNRLKNSTHSALRVVLEILQHRCGMWKKESPGDSIYILHSGYNNSGLIELHKRWNQWFPGMEPESLTAVSPFFDESPHHKCLADELQERFPNIKSITLITDESVFLGLSQAHFGASQTNNELYLIPKELNQQERERIERSARETGNSTKDQNLYRNLHAKILMLQSGNNALLYMGSANFTRKAWLGDNQELGIVSKVEHPDNMQKSIIKNLGAFTENKFDQLPQTHPAKTDLQDDEGYGENTNFPECIEHILLTPNEDHSKVQFRFELDLSLEDKTILTLSDYVVQWAGIKLEIDDHFCSQWIDREKFQCRLVGARNLSFRVVSDLTQSFWFPFQYENKLIDHRETFLLPSSWDWMAFYLNPDQTSSIMEPGEFLPGEPVGSFECKSTELLSISREKNCVIAMQGYLNIFCRLEGYFHACLGEIEKMEADCREKELVRQIIEPLNNFRRLLEREATESLKSKIGNQEVAPEHVFKLGELLLLVNSLESKLSGELTKVFGPLRSELKAILKQWSKDELHNKYITFVTNSEISE